jgi:predicted DsbA family dithiol-disulfide isomerase
MCFTRSPVHPLTLHHEMKVEVFSDISCPWCYIGRARFERALESFARGDAVEVVYRPYQLDPNAPAKAIPMYEYLERRFGPSGRQMAQRVIDNARNEGLTIDYERGLIANTLDAHRLLWLAEREYGPEVQSALAGSLFEAHFASGRDVGDAETLVELAARAGLDERRARDCLASGEGREEVRDEIDNARTLGITAVPTFIFDRKYAVQGAQPTSTFLQAFETVASENDAAG